MDLALKHNININIDDNIFNIEVRELNKKDKQALKDLSLKYKNEFKIEVLSSLEKEINELKQREYRQKELFKIADNFEEKKAINKDLEQILLSLNEKESEFFSLSKKLDGIDIDKEVNEKIFDKRVLGEDKERLRSYCEEQGLDLFEVLNIISTKVEDEKEKK